MCFHMKVNDLVSECQGVSRQNHAEGERALVALPLAHINEIKNTLLKTTKIQAWFYTDLCIGLLQTCASVISL